MKKIKILTGVCMIFLTLPMWYWLFYQILERVEATELMWFIYWAYVPIALFLAVVKAVLDSIEGDK